MSVRNVQFLYQPAEFYQSLVSLIQSARKRVCIATLYIGHSDMERKILEAIPADVPTTILLDGLRGNRRDKSSPATSVEMVQRFCAHAKCMEFVTPLYAGIYKILPSRVNEIVGTQHMKLIVVDDHVIITGANLSDIYFTDRQDRYLVLRDQPALADDLEQLVKRVRSSHRTENSKSRKYHILDNDVSLEFSVQHMGQDHVTLSMLQESALMGDLSPTKVTLCSPYLNLSPDIAEALRMFEHVDIITGSSSANAFYNSKGASRFIPLAYECMQSELMAQLPHAKFFNYQKPGWTFHPKGIWMERGGMPIETIIGSSNFGVRSHMRDLEISFRISSGGNPIIVHQLQTELGNIRQWIRPVEPSRIKSPMWLRFLSKKILRSFL